MGRLISCVVVVYMKVALCFQGEGHATVLRKSVVHLQYYLARREAWVFFRWWKTYVIEEPNPRRDFDDLLRRRGWLSVKIDKYFDIRLVSFANNSRGASSRSHRVK